jgi:hypothetical protein
MNQIGLDDQGKQMAGMVFARAKDDDRYSIYDYAAQFAEI